MWKTICKCPSVLFRWGRGASKPFIWKSWPNKLSTPLIFVFILVGTPNLTGQEKETERIEIRNADEGYYSKGSGKNRLLGNVVFEHEGALMYCDSAWLYSKENRLKAFENVKINQGDTLFLYGDYLEYSGNTRKAVVTGEKVRLKDPQMTLVTDKLNYDRNKKLAYYSTGGVINNDENELVSREGYYHSNTKVYNFKDSVVLTNPDYVIKSDTMDYNSQTRVAYFYCPTTINSDSSFIYCENGKYNTVRDVAQFKKNAYLYDDNKTLTADSLYYEQRTQFGEAFKNVRIKDTVNNYLITGDYGRYKGREDSIFVTLEPVYSVIDDNSDTLHIHGDTLYSTIQREKVPSSGLPALSSDSIPQDSTIADSLSRTQDSLLSDSALAPGLITDSLPKDSTMTAMPTDSLPNDSLPTDSLTADSTALANAYKADTLLTDSIVREHRLVKVYYDVKFYKSSIQGSCDSLTYTTRDSTFRMYRSPVLWDDSTQITGDTIYMLTKNDKPDTVKAFRNSFMISLADSTKYNQTSGTRMWGKFGKEGLRKVYVNGNGQTIYYPKQEDGTFIGMNKSICSNILIKLRNNEVKNIIFLKKPEANMYPLNKVPSDKRLLEGFNLRFEERPTRKKDIFD